MPDCALYQYFKGLVLKKVAYRTGTTTRVRTVVRVPCLTVSGATFGLFALGFATKIVFPRIMPDLEIYPAFGMELALGFFGGHGTAGLIGNILQKLNLPYWEVAQGVAVTSATVGIVCGILFGMIFINIAVRKNKITNLTDPADLPVEMRKGYQARIGQQERSCRETTHSSSVDSLAFHVAVVLVVCGISYFLVGFLNAHQVPLLSNIAEWAYAIAIMLVVNQGINRLNLGFLIDLKGPLPCSGRVPVSL